MIKHTQTMRRVLPTNYLSVLDHYMGVMLERLKNDTNTGNFQFDHTKGFLIKAELVSALLLISAIRANNIPTTK